MRLVLLQRFALTLTGAPPSVRRYTLNATLAGVLFEQPPSEIHLALSLTTATRPRLNVSSAGHYVCNGATTSTA